MSAAGSVRLLLRCSRSVSHRWFSSIFWNVNLALDPNDEYLISRSGWGKTADGPLQTVSPTLNKVTAPAISTADCAATYGDIVTGKKIPLVIISLC